MRCFLCVRHVFKKFVVWLSLDVWVKYTGLVLSSLDVRVQGHESKSKLMLKGCARVLRFSNRNVCMLYAGNAKLTKSMCCCKVEACAR